MKVSECMSRDVRIADPEDSLQEAAHMMAQLDAGFLPVGENDRLVGIITDRDIAVRGVGEGKGPDTPIRSVMTDEIKYCFEDEDADEVLDNMGEIQVRRLPVLNRDKRLVGIISITDIAESGASAHAGEALTEIARPSAYHSQSA